MTYVHFFHLWALQESFIRCFNRWRIYGLLKTLERTLNEKSAFILTFFTLHASIYISFCCFVFFFYLSRHCIAENLYKEGMKKLKKTLNFFFLFYITMYNFSFVGSLVIFFSCPDIVGIPYQVFKWMKDI